MADMRFKKGHQPWNKGKKGVHLSPLTEFKKEFVPWNKKEHLPKVCPKCEKKFSVIPSLDRVVFCSRSCARRGIPTSQLQKEIASKTHEGNQYALGRPAWNKGLKGFMAGEKHYNWKKDRSQLSKSDEFRNDASHREWSRQVKNRDYWECQISNSDCSGHVEAHHILSWSKFPELRYEIKNGITLCHFHHPRKRDEEEKLAPMFSELVLAKMH